MILWNALPSIIPLRFMRPGWRKGAFFGGDEVCLVWTNAFIGGDEFGDLELLAASFAWSTNS